MKIETLRERLAREILYMVASDDSCGNWWGDDHCIGDVLPDAIDAIKRFEADLCVADISTIESSGTVANFTAAGLEPEWVKEQRAALVDALENAGKPIYTTDF